MRINENYVKTGFAGQRLLVPTGRSGETADGVILLNETGERIVDLIGGGRTPAEIAEELSGEYDADAESLLAYVNDFIGELRSLGIVVDD